jgi:hypothetical protein
MRRIGERAMTGSERYRRFLARQREQAVQAAAGRPAAPVTKGPERPGLELIWKDPNEAARWLWRHDPRATRTLYDALGRVMPGGGNDDGAR